MVKRELIVLALLVLAGAARAAGQVPENIFHHEHDPAPALGASWLGLEKADAVLRLAAPRLSLEVTNKSERELTLALNVRLSADDTRQEFQVAGGAVPAGGAKVIMVELPAEALRLAGLRYAGRIDATLVAAGAEGRGVGAAEAPSVFYHPEGRELLVYRARALRGRFGAGNFRGEQLPDAGGADGVKRELALAEIRGVEPALARVQKVHVVAGEQTGQTQQGQRRFCLFMNSDAFNDSSNREYVWPNGTVSKTDYGEDYGRDGLALPLARGWVTVSQLGAPVYTGHLDGNGCTPYVPAAANLPATAAFFPLYKSGGGTNIQGYVSDLNLGDEWPESMPYFLFQLPPTPWAVTWAFADPEEKSLTIYTAAAAAMERFRGGHQNMTYGFRLGAEGNNGGTGTKYAPEGHPLVHVKYSTAAKSKFTIAHEYGHAVLMAKLNPQLAQSDLDYTVEEGEANQHTLTSKEWQLTAAVEGFAHFVSAVVWNEVGPGADAVIVDGSAPLPYDNDEWRLDTFDRVFENNYNPASYPGQGVEMDWAQFFWKYYTDPFFPPSQQTLMAFWLGSYEWPKHEGFFADYYGAAFPILTAQTPGYLPPGSLTQRFLIWAQAAGIIH